jgi:hypothetical protein
LTSSFFYDILEAGSGAVNDSRWSVTAERSKTMDFWDRMRIGMEKGLEGSRDLLGKARDRAQDLGERGVLRIEIMQLENQAEKLMGKLGARAYEALVKERRDRVDIQTEGISPIIHEIDEVRERIRAKELALEIAASKERGEKPSDP